MRYRKASGSSTGCLRTKRWPSSGRPVRRRTTSIEPGIGCSMVSVVVLPLWMRLVTQRRGVSPLPSSWLSSRFSICAEAEQRSLAHAASRGRRRPGRRTRCWISPSSPNTPYITRYRMSPRPGGRGRGRGAAPPHRRRRRRRLRHDGRLRDRRHLDVHPGGQVSELLGQAGHAAEHDKHQGCRHEEGTPRIPASILGASRCRRPGKPLASGILSVRLATLIDCGRLLTRDAGVHVGQQQEGSQHRRRRPRRPRLVRIIGRWDLTAAVINAVIGSAIFGMPAELARLTGASTPAGRPHRGPRRAGHRALLRRGGEPLPGAGGPYLYAREAFGSFVGFEAGWLTFWIRVTAMAANLNVFTEYLGRHPAGCGERAAAGGDHDGGGRPDRAGINLRGVRQATWAVDLFTAGQAAAAGAAGAWWACPRCKGAVLQTQQVADPQWTQAILLLMFAYGGFEAPLIPAGEARNPRRDSAFALLVALAVIATLYCLVQLAVVGLVPAVAQVQGAGGGGLRRAVRRIGRRARQPGGHGLHLRLRHRHRAAVAAGAVLDGRAGRAARGAGPRAPPLPHAPRGDPHLRQRWPWRWPCSAASPGTPPSRPSCAC